MHPAPSLIAFTTLSGLGFGLLAMLGLGLGPGAPAWAFAAGIALAGTGLLASTLHLGHPERALLAFTQWRSSWLSREAWLACATLAAAALHGACVILLDQPARPLGVLSALLCAATVTATAMIYAQLRTVPRWHHWSGPALFLAYAAIGGALLAAQTGLALVLLALAALGQGAAWIAGDRRVARHPSTRATATGLGGAGRVRLFEPPHTGPSYLTREMVYRIARKHALKLRAIAWILAFAVPAALLALPLGSWAVVPALLVHLGGVIVTRWLFFAEAEHVVGLYYGQGRAA